jgi:hypothetical protein
MKKIRELFDKNHIFYVEHFIEEIFFQSERNNSQNMIKNSSFKRACSYSYTTLCITHLNEFFYHPEINQNKDESTTNLQLKNLTARNFSQSQSHFYPQFSIVDENGFFLPVKSKQYFQG